MGTDPLAIFRQPLAMGTDPLAVFRQYIQTPDVPRLKEAGGGLRFLVGSIWLT